MTLFEIKQLVGLEIDAPLPRKLSFDISMTELGRDVVMQVDSFLRINGYVQIVRFERSNGIYQYVYKRSGDDPPEDVYQLLMECRMRLKEAALFVPYDHKPANIWQLIDRIDRWTRQP